MDREDAVGADALQGIFQSHSLGDEGAGPFHEQEGGVAFVQVPDCRRDAKGFECPDAAGPQHQLLVQAHLAAADIQDMRDGPVRLGIVRDVRVQQQDRHASYLDEPHRGVEVTLGQLDGNRERLSILADDSQDRQLGQVVVRVGVLLVAVRVDRLTEIPMLVEEPHADERHCHVAGRLDVIAGQNAEAA